jgi:hypothetical protein
MLSQIKKNHPLMVLQTNKRTKKKIPARTIPTDYTRLNIPSVIMASVVIVWQLLVKYRRTLFVGKAVCI